MNKYSVTLTDATGHSENADAPTVAVSTDQWKKKMATLKKRGAQAVQRMKSQGRTFQARVLGPLEVPKERFESGEYTLVAVPIDRDWRLPTKLEMVRDANHLLTNAYKIDQSALAYDERGQIRFYGDKNLVRYIDGPSGLISEPRIGKKVTVWGALGGANVGRIKAINQCEVYDYYGDGYARICGITTIESEDAIQGDSGSLVTYRGRGNRHVVGMLFGGDFSSDDRDIIPALNLQRAFARVGQPFSHFWGTRQGDRRPATTTTDD